MKKIPVSAVVVSCNEGFLLEDCLGALQFCDEIILIDLESEDNSIEIGNKLATKVISRPKAPYVEKQQYWVKDKTKHDWIFFIDADEVVDQTLALEIIELFEQGIDKQVCQILVPWQFYFKGKALKGTYWGGRNGYKNILVNRNRIIIQDRSQFKFKLIEGYKVIRITRKGENVLHHYWMRDYKMLFEKHCRYIRVEAKDKYEDGKRYHFFKQIDHSFRAFVSSFFLKKGYLEGFRGLFLSIFFSGYIFLQYDALRRYQQKIKK